MPRKPVFYSFHYANDALRVQMVRNIGALEGNAPVSPNAWEEVKRKGPTAIQKWIDDSMNYRRCVIVLVGEQTAGRHWVEYEIKKAWNDKRGLFGIYIHNLACMLTGKCRQGANPFERFKVPDGRLLSQFVPCYDPGQDAYKGISSNIEQWVDAAIVAANGR
ncbi:MAG TPA: TIR domain-containing protein [Gammaproteobacteria bacterium]|nr:TIR domain-containing protein [Gammaproteobacteria bacterium]